MGKKLTLTLMLVTGIAIGRAPHRTLPPYTEEAQPLPERSLSQYDAGRLNSVEIETASSGCSATVYGRSHHVILTAMHCIAGSGPIVAIDGKAVTTQVMSTDGADHIFVHVDQYLPQPGAVIDTRYPAVGSEVYIWGNPADMRMQLRVGRIAGEYVYNGVQYHCIDINTWHGDSGGAFFDANGHIVAVVFGHNPDVDGDGTTWMMRLARPLAFTPDQLREAGG